MKSCLDCISCRLDTTNNRDVAYCEKKIWSWIDENVTESLVAISHTAEVCEEFSFYKTTFWSKDKRWYVRDVVEERLCQQSKVL